MIDQLWSLLTTLTPEAQKQATARIKELGFDPDRGVVRMAESLNNLQAVRSLLMESISQKKLIQLPITVQKRLLNSLDAISKGFAGLVAGADEVVNIVDNIERLNTDTWVYGLHNLSPQVLGYTTKLNQLKALEREHDKLRADLEESLARRPTLDALLLKAEEGATAVVSQLTAVQASAAGVEQLLTSTTESANKASALTASIQQNETTSATTLAASRTSGAEITALETRLKEFYATVDEHRTSMEATEKRATQAVAANKEATDALITELRALESKIKVQIEKATGFSLFHSFQTRQAELSRSKWLWAYALAGLIALSISLTIYILRTTTSLDIALYVKLSISLPLIFAIVFCTVQYGRERRLEEEYAFKSNISISLVPYKDLIGQITASGGESELAKYTAFLIEAVGRVFSSPTDRVFHSEQREKPLSDRLMRQALDLAKEVIQATRAKP